MTEQDHNTWGIHLTVNYLDDTEEDFTWNSHMLTTAMQEIEEFIREQTNVTSYLITLTVPQRRWG